MNSASRGRAPRRLDSYLPSHTSRGPYESRRDETWAVRFRRLVRNTKRISWFRKTRRASRVHTKAQHSTSTAPAPTPSTNTCGKTCKSNTDCATGGFLECGQCNLEKGTFGYHTCMAAPTTPPTDAPPNPCGKPCKEDKDCNGSGGFFGNTCLVSGTRCAGHCAKRD